MEHCVYHGIEVQVEGSDGECISQICQCTGYQSWHTGDPRNDWVWVKQWPGRCYGALNRRLPLQLQRLFKIKLLNEDGTIVKYWSALALTTIPEISGNLDPVLKFVQVRNVLAAVALQDFRVRNIVGCTHVVREIATSSKAADRWNKRCIVNRHIDLATWNDVYN
jgi:hypothetical protein